MMEKSAGRYYRITPRFWQDTDIRNEWTEDMRFLAIYLMTSPHRNMVGLFYCPLVYMENDLQWQSKRLRVAFDALSSANFIRYDDKAQVIFIINSLKHDSPGTGKQVEGAIRVLKGLPFTPLLKDLLDAATMQCECLANAMRMAFDWQSIDTRIPYPYSVPVFRIPNPDTEGVETKPSSPSGDPPGPALPSAQETIDLWNSVCGQTLPRVSKLTPGRSRAVKARLREKGRNADWWRAYFSRIAASSFCGGDNDRGWKADFDFATRSEDVIANVLEGKYDDRKPVAQVAAPPPIPIRTKSMEQLIAEAEAAKAAQAERGRQG